MKKILQGVVIILLGGLWLKVGWMVSVFRGRDGIQMENES